MTDSTIINTLKDCHYFLSQTAKFRQPIVQQDLDGALRRLARYIQALEEIQDDADRAQVLTRFEPYGKGCFPQPLDDWPQLKDILCDVLQQLIMDGYRLEYFEAWAVCLLQHNTSLQDKLAEVTRELRELKATQGDIVTG